MSIRIKKQFISYRNSSSTSASQALKYGLGFHSLYLKDQTQQRTSELRRKIIMLKKMKRIQKIFTNDSLNYHQDLDYLLSRIPSIKELVLNAPAPADADDLDTSINSINSQSTIYTDQALDDDYYEELDEIPENVFDQKQIPKSQRRMFLKAKRVENLSLEMTSLNKKNFKSLKNLFLLRDLKTWNMKIKMKDRNELLLFHQFVRMMKNRSRINGVIFNINYAYNDRNFNWNLSQACHILDITAQEVTKSKQGIYFKIKIKNMNRVNSDTLETLSKTIRRIKRIVSLNLELDLSSASFSSLLDGLSRMKSLQELTLRFTNLNDSSEFLDKLAESLSQVETLKSLKMNLCNGNLIVPYQVSKQPSFNAFLREIGKISQLKELKIESNHRAMNDIALNLFSESLVQLNRLQLLVVNISRDHNSSLDHASVNNLFKELRNLKDLRALDLNVRSYGISEGDYLFKTLCDSLENLVKLKRFEFNFNLQKLSDSNINNFAQIISKLHDLETLKLNFGKVELITMVSFTRLLKSLSYLKGLGLFEANLSLHKFCQRTCDALMILLGDFRRLESGRLQISCCEIDEVALVKIKDLGTRLQIVVVKV